MILREKLVQTGATIVGGLLVLAGVISLIFAPLIGDDLFTNLWGVEPLAYIGAVLLIAGLGAISASYLLPRVLGRWSSSDHTDSDSMTEWSKITEQYFELFDHDLGRPLRRILGKERELRAILRSSGAETNPAVHELLDEIERQTPSFRLMMSNIRVLVQLEAPRSDVTSQPVELSEVIRRIVDRYTAAAVESKAEITWWAEPAEFGLVYSDSSAIEHIVTNLVDNAIRFASEHVEVKVSRNPTHFFVRVWDDGPGIPSQYVQHIFDRGWTPEVARREEKSGSGLGLFIARTLATREGGELTVESVASPSPDHHATFLLTLPLGESRVTLQ